MDRSRVVVAEILRSRGNRGELLARSQTDVPGRLEALREAWLHLQDGSDRPVVIESGWPYRGDWVLKFGGVDTIDAADELRGADLWIPPEQRASLPEGVFYQADLIGCRLVNAANGESVGLVRGWQENGGGLLMEVSCQGREVLIPFVLELCRVELEEKRLSIDLPQGLLDL